MNLERKASVADVAKILPLVVLVFLFCMSDKTLVGILLIVPFLFLLIGIPWVLMIWLDRIMNMKHRFAGSNVAPPTEPVIKTDGPNV